MSSDAEGGWGETAESWGMEELRCGGGGGRAGRAGGGVVCSRAAECRGALLLRRDEMLIHGGRCRPLWCATRLRRAAREARAVRAPPRPRVPRPDEVILYSGCILEVWC